MPACPPKRALCRECRTQCLLRKPHWATTFGPVFVTADELPTLAGDPAPRLAMRASVNGRQYSDGNLGDLFWSFADMISYASRGTEVRPGDIIGSGTVGTGCIADLAARHGA